MDEWPPATEDGLQQLVQAHLEESAQLDFKRLPGSNEALAKDLAAMSNAGGGVLIYGIDQDSKGKAASLKPFPLAGQPERIGNIARTTIDGPVSLETVTQIPSSEAADQGFIVVMVSGTERGPHLVNGAIWGRSPKGNMPLTRRQAGELFARSKGFAQEFGLMSGKPGRMKVSSDKQVRPGTTGSVDFYLIFENVI